MSLTSLQVFCLSLEATATCNLHADHAFPLAVWLDFGSRLPEKYTHQRSKKMFSGKPRRRDRVYESLAEATQARLRIQIMISYGKDHRIRGT